MKPTIQSEKAIGKARCQRNARANRIFSGSGDNSGNYSTYTRVAISAGRRQWLQRLLA
jgi:hypothetical protein